MHVDYRHTNRGLTNDRFVRSAQFSGAERYISARPAHVEGDESGVAECRTKGGGGDDTLLGRDGEDTLVGDADLGLEDSATGGNDSLDYRDYTTPVDVDLSGCCATGIGAATRKRLEAQGHEVIGVDIKDAEVVADLSTAEGRTLAVDEVLGRSAGKLDRAAFCAGLGGHIDDIELVIAVNDPGMTLVNDRIVCSAR